MNKEFLKMQKIAGLLTESEFKEKTDEVIGPWSINKNSDDDIHNNNADEDYDGEEMNTLDQDVYMAMLNAAFKALGSEADAYSENTWGQKEKDLANKFGEIIRATNIDLL